MPVTLGVTYRSAASPVCVWAKCEQRKRRAGCLTSRDGIKDGDFPVDRARRAASLDAKDGVIEFMRPFLCSLCSRVPTRSEFSHLAAFSYFFFFFLFSCVFSSSGGTRWNRRWFSFEGVFSSAARTSVITVGDVGLARCARSLIKRNLAYL